MSQSLSINTFSSEDNYVSAPFMSDATKSRNWVFTYNNPGPYRPQPSPNVSYMVYQLEQGASGTPHLQGYIQFKNPVAFNTVRNFFDKKAHVERAMGQPQECHDYCTKEEGRLEEPFIYGVMKGGKATQGQRTDLLRACEMVKEGGLKRVAEQDPVIFLKFHRGLSALRTILAPRRNEVPKVVVLYGDTGCGKSRTARNMMPRLEGQEPPCADYDQFWVWDPNMGSWFQGYDQQKWAIFEEFRGQLTFGAMLSLLDRYDCQVQNKGGSAHWLATRIVITSPVHPREWYQSLATNDGQLQQLLRRITQVIHLTNEFPVSTEYKPEIEGWD